MGVKAGRGGREGKLLEGRGKKRKTEEKGHRLGIKKKFA